MNILLAYDGSDGARAALHDLVNVGIPRGSSLHVLAIAESTAMAASEVASLTGVAEITYGSDALTTAIAVAGEQASRHAREAGHEIRAMLPEIDVTQSSGYGAAASEILNYAEEHETDLIVMGSHGRGALSRMFLGSVALRVLHGAPCSVRIVKHEAREGGLRKLLIAVDGSPDSDLMLDVISQRKWDTAPECTIINVDDLALMVSIHGVGIELINNETGKLSADILRSARERLSSSAITVSEMVTRLGNPVVSLLDEAERRAVDVIYLGARGHGMLERLFLGSVSHGVAARADCVVEVIR